MTARIRSMPIGEVQPNENARSSREPWRLLFVGAGGLGTCSARVLAHAAHRLAAPLAVTVVDDDRVAPENLHRQVLYRPRDVGRPKAPLFAQRFAEIASERGASVSAVALETRFTPENARDLVRTHDLVVEGSDNFATKFLVADAARLESRAVVHAGVVRWVGYALASGPEGSPCLRCLFEDLPRGQPDTCAVAGVVGPVVALVAALQARLLVGVLAGIEPSFATLVHVDALRGGPIRVRSLRKRALCSTCGPGSTLRAIDPDAYGAAHCDKA